MCPSEELSPDEVDARLDILQTNLNILAETSEELINEHPDKSLGFMSLAQAFYDESEQLETIQEGSINDRYAAIDHVLANLSEIRAAADPALIDLIDTESETELEMWN